MQHNFELNLVEYRSTHTFEAGSCVFSFHLAKKYRTVFVEQLN